MMLSTVELSSLEKSNQRLDCEEDYNPGECGTEQCAGPSEFLIMSKPLLTILIPIGKSIHLVAERSLRSRPFRFSTASW